MSEQKVVVLFLCSGNVARSQMAEAFLRKLGGDHFEVYSAGLAPAENIHPLTHQVMEEIGMDLRGQHPKPLKDYFRGFRADFVIFVCEKGEQNCPFLWPSTLKSLSWPLENPVNFQGPEDQCLQVFRRVRDQIEQRVRAWVNDTAVHSARSQGV